MIISDGNTDKLDQNGDVATVTVDRPDALNSLNPPTLETLAETIEDTAGDTRVLIVTGASDEAFVAGADIKHMMDLSTQEAYDWCSLGHRVCDSLPYFPGVTIAAVNGYAFGGGFEVLLACDLRVAGESAVVGSTEIDLGIVPGWGGSQRLPRLVGDETARRMIYLGRRLDAETAADEGLFSDVVPDDELDDNVSELTEELAAKPFFALRAAKESVTHRHRGQEAVAMAHEKRTFAGLFGTHDQREGMAAFIENRESEFE